MHFTLVSITRKALEFASVQSVTIPTKNGEITVFPNHESLITALVPGVLMVRADGGNTSYAIG
jgi:F0F1-type ATP synthase epsilon subunit